MPSASQIFTVQEVIFCVKEGRYQSGIYRCPTRNPGLRNLAIFRLACGCGLRRCEIQKLTIGDVITDGPRPTIRVRAQNTKGRSGKKRGRRVPLWWDSGTLEDLARYRKFRVEVQGATDSDPFISGQTAGHENQPIKLGNVAERFSRIVRNALGKERSKQLSIHCGRHSFASHALNVGHSLVEVRDALGHSSIHTTSIYAHLIEREGVLDLYGGGGE